MLSRDRFISFTPWPELFWLHFSLIQFLKSVSSGKQREQNPIIIIYCLWHMKHKQSGGSQCFRWWGKSVEERLDQQPLYSFTYGYIYSVQWVSQSRLAWARSARGERVFRRRASLLHRAVGAGDEWERRIVDAVVTECAAAGVVVARGGRATAVQQTSFVFLWQLWSRFLLLTN